MRAFAKQWRAFYQGLTPPLVSLAFLNTISFTVYGQCKRLIAHHTSSLVPAPGAAAAAAAAATARPQRSDISSGPMWHSALAGSVTGIGIGVCSTPFDLVKVQAQLQRSQPSAAASGSWSTAKRLVRAHGLRVLYRGYAVNTAREALFGAVYFGAYHSTKRAVLQAAEAVAAGLSVPLAVVVAGSASGMSGWLVSFPLDVIKTKVQGAPDLSVRYTASLPLSLCSVLCRAVS